VVYSKLAPAEPESPQWYFAQVFKTWEEKYGLSPLVMRVVDSFTWQLVYALGWQTPFEKPKKETALFLIKKQTFHFVYDLMRGKFFEPEGKNYKVSGDLVIQFLADSYEKIFSDIVRDYKSAEVFYKEINDFCQNPSKKDIVDYKQDIVNWRNKKVYNPDWKVLKPLLDCFFTKNRKSIIHRLIGLYLLKNAKRALGNILNISEQDQEKIIIDIVTMINENKKPENFYEEKDDEFIEQINLVYMCLAYQHQDDIDIERLQEIIKTLENKCPHSKMFFSPWLNSRAKIFTNKDKLDEDKNRQQEIIDGYKEAFENGMNYAGCYLAQFLLEAIMINKYFYPDKVKNTNDFWGYGYALEIFGDDKQKLLDLVNRKEYVNLRMEFVSLSYSNFNLRWGSLSNKYPDLHSVFEFKNKAMEINNKGLEYEKAGDYISAEQYFSEAICLNATYVNAYSNRGNLYDKLGLSEYALQNFNMAILLDPRHENTLFKRGSLLMKMERFEDAIKDFSLVISINPKASDAYAMRGICYKITKNMT
jgi:tetratricopeptide (TPR) repeat protein